MPRICRAPGCAAETSSRYSPFCQRHRARLRRHGSVDQRAVTKADLKGYLKRVRARIEKNPDSPAWSALEGRWEALQQHAREVEAYFQSGRAGPRYERRAAHEVMKLGQAVEAREVIVTALAMWVLQELEPRRFKSDAAFRSQLIRRVRGLSD